ncbi:MAG: ATP-dependent helicase, partial [Bacteroidetes bacterium]|nr:ATP-dependent helicase [Bacteroidota bacterium]
MQTLNSNIDSQNLYNSLNKEQKEAVDLIEGAVLIIAGPGTGKTKLITARVANILLKTDVNPENILCLTFTNAASQEMRARLEGVIGISASKVGIFTYHSFCNNVIQNHTEYLEDLDLEPVSEIEQQTFIRKLIDNLTSDNILYRVKGDRYFDENRLIKLFSEMKKENWLPEKVETEIDKLKKEEIKFKRTKAAANLFNNYNSILKGSHRYDYDDMILFVNKIFQENKNLLLSYQEKYQYIMVDEFQDTNGSQFELLSLLLNYWDHPNILCVGDDDQCIFEFQGARLHNVIEFSKIYNPKIITLAKNYRSTPEILSLASLLINNNQERLINIREDLTKNLIAESDLVKNLNIKPTIQFYSNAFEESADIVNSIEKIYKENPNTLPEIAILFRENIQSDIVSKLLIKKNIPFKFKKTLNLINHPIYQMVITMLKFFANELDKTSFGELELFKMMHFQYFEIDPNDVARISIASGSSRGTTSIRLIIDSAERLKKLNLNNPESIFNFNNLIKALFKKTKSLSAINFVEELINTSGLLKFILNCEENIKIDNLNVLTSLFETLTIESRTNNLKGIEKLVDHFNKIEEMEISININLPISVQNGITLATCHSSKGLEFERVYLMGCIEKKWKQKTSPNQFALPPGLYSQDKIGENNESGRRLFYVGMTRAKKYLQISYYKNPSEISKNLKPEEPSQFISEIKNSESVVCSDLKQLKPKDLQEAQQNYLQKSVLEDKIEFNKDIIDEYISNIRISPSALNSLIKCGNQFYFENILKVPGVKNEALILGSAIH